MNGEKLARFFCAGNHFFQIGTADRNGLFTDNVFACIHCLDSNRFMHIVGGSYRNEIYFRICEECFKDAKSAWKALLADFTPWMREALEYEYGNLDVTEE